MPKAYPLFNPNVEAVFGGAEVDLYYLATELAKDDSFTVSFITADYGQEPVETTEAVKVIKSLDFNQNPLTGALKIWRAMKKANADIYLLKTTSPGTPLVAFFCLVNKRKFLYRAASARDCDGSYLAEHYFLGKAFKWSLHKAGLVFTQNETDKSNLADTVGVSAITIPNGHRLTELPQGRRDTILWVGRSAAVKQPQLFLQLADTMPDEKFTFICQRATGDKYYDKLVARAKAVKNLEFIERVPFGQVESYFARAKVFVNTSDSEGFANTFIQACKAATPILSLAVNPDCFLDKYKCGLCADKNWEKFVSQCKMLTEPAKIKEFGRNGRRYVEEYHDVAKIVEKYKELFRQTISNKTENSQ